VKQSGPTPVLIKAEVPWSAKRGALSDKDRVVKSVKGYCQQLILFFSAFVFEG
jgi:translation initiation factor 4G